MSPPNKLSRRGFLGLFRKDPPSDSAATARVPGPVGAPASTPSASPPSGEPNAAFSLESFYAARVPATELYVKLAPNLPRVATTSVGVPDLVPALGPPAPACPDAAAPPEARVASAPRPSSRKTS